MNKLIISSLLWTMTLPVYAMFCPGNFNQINVGDTIDQVQTQCGKPDFSKKSDQVKDDGPQEWGFYVKPGGNNGARAAASMNNPQGSLKMAVTFNQGKVINITVNGMSLASTTLCGAPISVGNNTAAVKAACGDPFFVNKATQNNNAEAKTEVTTFRYNSTPPVTLTFENGKLTH